MREEEHRALERTLGLHGRFGCMAKTMDSAGKVQPSNAASEVTFLGGPIAADTGQSYAHRLMHAPKSAGGAVGVLVSSGIEAYSRS